MSDPRADDAGELMPLDRVSELLEAILASSPADETELLWLESRRQAVSNRGKRIKHEAQTDRMIQVRVLDRGRVGSHRTSAATVGELEAAVRAAVAQSRVREPLAGLPHLPADSTSLTIPGSLRDDRLARLNKEEAGDLIGSLPRARETLTLEWSEINAAVFSSRAVRRKISVTGAAFEARCGRRPGAGRAATAARGLDRLEIESELERARRRTATGEVAEPPSGSLPVVLSGEAVIDLCRLLNQVAFSAVSYYDGSSFLRQHLGVQVFDRDLALRDDGTDPAGLPFPFDLEGTAKRPVDLILKGIPKTPALDQRQAARLGLPPTASAIAGNDARALNLFLQPGEQSEEELLAACDGGLWLGWLYHLESHEPQRVQFRARAGGVRRIRAGKLAEALPDLVWEDSLLRALSTLLGIARETTLRVNPDGFLGGTSAPALAIGDVDRMRPARRQP